MPQTMDQAHIINQTPAESAVVSTVSVVRVLYYLSLHFCVVIMAKFSVRSSSKKKGSSGGGLVRLKFVVEKLQKSLLMVRNSSNKSSSNYVPEGVKEGHFAVIAEGGEKEEPKRFVIPLSCLTNPTFLRLLEQAAEEYGFDHEGALTIPCRPSVLQRMLVEQQWQQDQEGGPESWNSCNESMVLQSY